MLPSHQARDGGYQALWHRLVSPGLVSSRADQSSLVSSLWNSQVPDKGSPVPAGMRAVG